MPATDTE